MQRSSPYVHCAPVGQKYRTAAFSGSRTCPGSVAAGPLERIAYSVPSAASKRWSMTCRGPLSASV